MLTEVVLVSGAAPSTMPDIDGDGANGLISTDRAGLDHDGTDTGRTKIQRRSVEWLRTGGGRLAGTERLWHGSASALVA